MQEKGNIRNKQKNLAAVQQINTVEGKGRPGIVLHIHLSTSLALQCNDYNFIVTRIFATITVSDNKSMYRNEIECL